MLSLYLSEEPESVCSNAEELKNKIKMNISGYYNADSPTYLALGQRLRELGFYAMKNNTGELPFQCRYALYQTADKPDDVFLARFFITPLSAYADTPAFNGLTPFDIVAKWFKENRPCCKFTDDELDPDAAYIAVWCQFLDDIPLNVEEILKLDYFSNCPKELLAQLKGEGRQCYEKIINFIKSYAH